MTSGEHPHNAQAKSCQIYYTVERITELVSLLEIARAATRSLLLVWYEHCICISTPSIAALFYLTLRMVVLRSIRLP